MEIRCARAVISRFAQLCTQERKLLVSVLASPILVALPEASVHHMISETRPPVNTRLVALSTYHSHQFGTCRLRPFAYLAIVQVVRALSREGIAGKGKLCPAQHSEVGA